VKELTSAFFKSDKTGRLHKCLNFDPSHITPETRDPIVFYIQEALRVIDGFIIQGENNYYGPKTAWAVREYKRRRGIQRPGQPLDNIVGMWTIERMDKELAKIEHGGGVDPPKPSPLPKPDPLPGDFNFVPLQGPLIIKQSSDDPTKQDLESAPVHREAAKLRACTFSNPSIVGAVTTPTASLCKSNLLGMIGRGGAVAREVAEFFIANGKPGMLRNMPAVWGNLVSRDLGFQRNHREQTLAIRNSLRDLASRSPGTPKTIDVNLLRDGASQPMPLRIFANDIDFAFQSQPGRFIAGDPLSFGIGSIQGLTVSIVEFNGRSDGEFEGKLLYELFDHFGSDDGDIIDPGQAGLWLLQRKMAKDQDPTAGCNPYRLRIAVTMGFSGSL
jgi:hypothetical protein